LLLQIPAAVRFVSCEPLLSSVDLQPWIPRLDWVIAGAETGPGARPMYWMWARRLMDQCNQGAVPFFFKKDSSGQRTLDGVIHDEYPSSVEGRDEETRERLFLFFENGEPGWEAYSESDLPDWARIMFKDFIDSDSSIGEMESHDDSFLVRISPDSARTAGLVCSTTTSSIVMVPGDERETACVDTRVRLHPNSKPDPGLARLVASTVKKAYLDERFSADSETINGLTLETETSEEPADEGTDGRP
jgi:hypothetical protein